MIEIGAWSCDEECLARGAVYVVALFAWLGLSFLIHKLGAWLCTKPRKGD